MPVKKPALTRSLDNDSLKAFRLCYSKASVNSLHPAARGKPTDVEQKISVSPLASDEGGVVKAEINFSLVAGELLEVTAVYHIEISIEEVLGSGKTEAVLQSFGLNSIVNVAWPYWRSHLARLLIEFGLPPLKLPIFLPIDLTHKDVHAPSIRKAATTKNTVKKR